MTEGRCAGWLQAGPITGIPTWARRKPRNTTTLRITVISILPSSRFQPSSLESIPEAEARQIARAHVPHGHAGGEEHHVTVSLREIVSMSPGRQLKPREHEDHSQERRREQLEEHRDRVGEKEAGEQHERPEDHERPAGPGAETDVTRHSPGP